MVLERTTKDSIHIKHLTGGDIMNNLLLEIENGIALLTINRPKSLNALNSETLAELNTCLADLEKNADVKVVILTGSGEKSFVAGADISEMVNATAAEGRTMGLLAREAFGRLENMPQVTIAAVNGFALGGGCELAMSCDIILASEKAKFGQPEVGLGITPGFSGTQRLPRRVGIAKAKELTFSGKMISAEEAKEIGLANAVYAPEELLNAAKEMANSFLKNSPVAVKYAKVCIDRGMQLDIDSAIALENEMFALCYASPDQKEGMTAFLEKRPAVFQ